MLFIALVMSKMRSIMRKERDASVPPMIFGEYESISKEVCRCMPGTIFNIL